MSLHQLQYFTSASASSTPRLLLSSRNRNDRKTPSYSWGPHSSDAYGYGPHIGWGGGDGDPGVILPSDRRSRVLRPFKLVLAIEKKSMLHHFGMEIRSGPAHKNQILRGSFRNQINAKTSCPILDVLLSVFIWKSQHVNMQDMWEAKRLTQYINRSLTTQDFLQYTARDEMRIQVSLSSWLVSCKYQLTSNSWTIGKTIA